MNRFVSSCILLFALFAAGCGGYRHSYSAWYNSPAWTGPRVAEAPFMLPITPVEPPPGFIFSQYQAPLKYDFTQDGEPTNVKEMKKVTLTSRYINLWPLSGSAYLSSAWTEPESEEAVEESGFSRVHYSDYETLNVLGVYIEFDIHMYGN